MPIATIHRTIIDPWLKFKLTSENIDWELVENLKTSEQMVVIKDQAQPTQIFGHSFMKVVKNTFTKFLKRKPVVVETIKKSTPVPVHHNISNIKPSKPVSKRSTVKAKKQAGSRQQEAMAKMKKIVENGIND